MKKTLLIICGIFLFLSCSKEEFIKTNDRLVFTNTDEFDETYVALQGISSIESMLDWAESKKS